MYVPTINCGEDAVANISEWYVKDLDSNSALETMRRWRTGVVWRTEAHSRVMRAEVVVDRPQTPQRGILHHITTASQRSSLVRCMSLIYAKYPEDFQAVLFSQCILLLIPQTPICPRLHEAFHNNRNGAKKMQN